jgi:uptake hydrogenase large subunit
MAPKVRRVESSTLLVLGGAGWVARASRYWSMPSTAVPPGRQREERRRGIPRAVTVARSNHVTDEGTLTIKLVDDGARVSDVQVSSTRRTDFSAVLTGLPVNKALGLVPTLFSLCASAQAVAGLEACEAALGLEADEGNKALRQVLVALEAVDNHAFQFFVEWPRVVGRPAEIEPLRAVRAACQTLRLSLTERVPWVMPGGAALRGPPAGMGRLREVVARSVPNPLEAGEAALGRWSRFLAAAVEAGARGLGRTDTPLVGIEGAEWFARHLGDPAFSATPTLDGAPAESGSLGYVQEVAPVDAVLAAEGRTVWARLLAQLTNLHRLIDLVDGALVRIPGARLATPRQPPPRAGAGVADTSRGRLAHAVRIEGGRITFWRTVAPTEWSFHPRGIVPSALVGLEVRAAEALAPFLVASLDPCVACRIVCQEPRRR